MTLKPVPTSGRSKVTSSIAITICAKGRNMLHSTELHWCNKVYFFWSGRHARETYWWLLERRFEQKFVRFSERTHKIHSVERETSQRVHVVPSETDKSSNDYETRSGRPEVWTKMGKAAQKKEKQEWEIIKKRWENAGSSNGGGNALAKSNEFNKIPQTKHPCILEAHESTRQRVDSSLPQDHGEHIVGRGYNSMTHYNLAHKFIPMPQAMRILDAKAALDNMNGRSSETNQSLTVGFS